MATYYVRKSGNDANDGLTPATAWATIGKALGSAGMASGDVCYVGAGTYREIVTVAIPVNPTAATKLIGDVTGAQTGDAGPVIWSGYTSGDNVGPSGGILLSLNSRDFINIENFYMVAGGHNMIESGASGVKELKCRNCVWVLGAGSGMIGTFKSGANNSLFENISIVVPHARRGIEIALPTVAAGDYNSGIKIHNCSFIGSRDSGFVFVSGSGVETGKGGGVEVFNCFDICGSGVTVLNANVSTTFPVEVYNNIFLAGNSVVLSANVAGQIVEDYNHLAGNPSHSNVTAGTNTKTGTGQAVLMDFGSSVLWRLMQPRPFLMPLSSSPYLGAGGQAGGPTADMGDVTRPAGGKIVHARGPFEYHPSGAIQTSVFRTGPHALQIQGPGIARFYVPVDAQPTTLSVYGRYDPNHGSANKPQLVIKATPELGIASDQVTTMTAAADTWEQLALTVSPTAAGAIEVWLRSRSAAENGSAFFDDQEMS